MKEAFYVAAGSFLILALCWNLDNVVFFVRDHWFGCMIAALTIAALTIAAVRSDWMAGRIGK